MRQPFAGYVYRNMFVIFMSIGVTRDGNRLPDATVKIKGRITLWPPVYYVAARMIFNLRRAKIDPVK